MAGGKPGSSGLRSTLKETPGRPKFSTYTYAARQTPPAEQRLDGDIERGRPAGDDGFARGRPVEQVDRQDDGANDRETRNDIGGEMSAARRAQRLSNEWRAREDERDLPDDVRCVGAACER